MRAQGRSASWACNERRGLVAVADLKPRCGRDSCEGCEAYAVKADKGMARAFTLDELKTATFPPRPPILMAGDQPILRAGDIAMALGMRGVGKSLYASALALAVGTAGPFLRWHALERRGVLLIDGEMPSNTIKERLTFLADQMGIDSCPNFNVIARDWQDELLPRLDTPAGQALVEPHITADDGLVILDNAVTLFDVEAEKDPTAWQGRRRGC